MMNHYVSSGFDHFSTRDSLSRNALCCCAGQNEFYSFVWKVLDNVVDVVDNETRKFFTRKVD